MPYLLLTFGVGLELVDEYTKTILYIVKHLLSTFTSSVLYPISYVPHAVVFYQETLVKPFYQSFVLLTLLGIYLFICFNAIGGMGNSGNKSVRRCSIPMARSSEMKLLSVIFWFTPCSRWLMVVRLTPDLSAISLWLIRAASRYSFKRWLSSMIRSWFVVHHREFYYKRYVIRVLLCTPACHPSVSYLKIVIFALRG